MLPSAMLCRCGRRHAGTLRPLAARALPCRLKAAALQEVADAILASRSSRTDHHNDLRHVLKSLQQKDPDGHFAHAVDTTLVFDYLDVVSEPMDFSTMCGRSRFAFVCVLLTRAAFLLPGPQKSTIGVTAAARILNATCRSSSTIAAPTTSLIRSTAPPQMSWNGGARCSSTTCDN